MKVCDLYVIVMGLIPKDYATILKKDIGLPFYLFFMFTIFAWCLLRKEEGALRKRVFLNATRKKNNFLAAIFLSQGSSN